jgi:hypothetical protein
MQCFVCGGEMRVVKVEPHVTGMQGFELRTFQCVGCGDVEKRTVFDSSRIADADSSRITDPIVAQPLTPPDASPPPVGKVRSFFGNLVRLRGASRS